MANDIPVKITKNTELEGQQPVVILGPNGAGKTRHAVNMIGWNDADMIPALRNIALNQDVPMQSLTQAEKSLTQFHQQRRSRHWEMSNEINHLFSKLLAEDSASAVTFRDQFVKGRSPKPETTKLTVLQDMWGRLFPGRKVSFAGYTPMVSSAELRGGSSYAAQHMSDGERVALYLAARVLDCSKAILIIDEPEVHFHSRLAVRFWNELEDRRDDVRFVYVTHDLPFALSRRDAKNIILKSPGTPSVVQLQEDLPHDLAHSLLAAASFSIHAQRIVFCEGEEGKSS